MLYIKYFWTVKRSLSLVVQNDIKNLQNPLQEIHTIEESHQQELRVLQKLNISTGK